MWEEGECVHSLVWITEGKREFVRRKHNWNDKIKMDL